MCARLLRPLSAKDRYFWGTTAGAAAATFDIAVDGRRLLIIRPLGDPDAPPATSNLIVVQNWFKELKRLVP